MYSSSSVLPFVVSIIAIPILLILLTGFILSIVIFFRKSRVAEILAWIFNSLWFIFDLFLLSAGVFRNTNIPNFFIFPILLTFFLLLQYRSNSSSGNRLKKLYVVKTSLILVMFSQLSTQIFNLIIQRSSGSVDRIHLNLIMPLTTLICVLLIGVFTAFRYLKRTEQQLITTGILKNAAIFLIIVSLCSELIGRVIGFIEILSYGEGRSIFINQLYFNPMSLLYALGYCLLITILGSLIAGYTYLYYAKDKTGLSVDNSGFPAIDEYPDTEEK